MSSRNGVMNENEVEIQDGGYVAVRKKTIQEPLVDAIKGFLTKDDMGTHATQHR